MALGRDPEHALVLHLRAGGGVSREGAIGGRHDKVAVGGLEAHVEVLRGRVLGQGLPLAVVGPGVAILACGWACRGWRLRWLRLAPKSQRVPQGLCRLCLHCYSVQWHSDHVEKHKGRVCTHHRH